MFRILFGFILGCVVTLTAMNPDSAKVIASKSIDKMHQSYNAGLKAVDSPVLPAPAPAPVVPTPVIAPQPGIPNTPDAPPVPPVPGAAVK